MKKVLYLFIFCIMFFITKSFANNEIKDFVVRLGNEFDTINKVVDKNEKLNSSYEITKKYVDINWMGNFILGRHRKELNKEQIATFVDLFSQFLLKNYIDIFSSLSNDNFTFKDTKLIKENNYLCDIELYLDQKLVKVDLRIVKTKNNTYVIRDILPEGLSFINTQRNEIDSIINTKGFDFLINDIKNKID